MNENYDGLDIELETSGNGSDALDDMDTRACDATDGRQKVEAKLEELRMNRIEQDYDYV